MKLADHFFVLIYPFRHDLPSERRDKRLGKLDPLWRSWWQRLSVEEQAEETRNTRFFYPYVRNILFPEVDRIEKAAGGASSRTDEPLEELARRVPDDAVLHLTAKPAIRDELAQLVLKGPTGDSDHKENQELHLDWLDLCLFPQRAGFLLFRMRWPGAEDVQQLARVLRSVTWVTAPAPGWPLPRWRLSRGDETVSSADLVDFFLQGLTRELQGDPAPDLSTFLSAKPLTTQRYTTTPHSDAYGSSFASYVYARTADVPRSDAQAEEALLHLTLGVDPTKDEGKIPEARRKALMEDHRLALWENWRGMVLQDRVVFLGLGDTDFNRRALKSNCASDYFFLHLFTRFQKLHLSLLNDRLLQAERSPKDRLKESRRNWRRFLTFQTLYWYSEITPRAQGREIYNRFRRGLEVTPLYEEMKEEIGQLQSYYERRAEQRITRVLNFLTFVGLPAGLLVGLFGPSVVKQVSNPVTPTWWGIGGSSVGVLLFTLLIWWLVGRKT
jgi:hypothetical protein